MENQQTEVPFAHYAARFSELDPGKAAKNGFDWDGKEFYVNLLGRDLWIAHPAFAIRAKDGDPLPERTVQTFLMRCLLQKEWTPVHFGWKTFREMPWGEVYQKPFSGRILRRCAHTFGTRLEEFKGACVGLGGKPIPESDAGFEFTFLPGHYLRLLIWAGDEEFPPNAQLLYSDNFARSFSAEDRVIAAEILLNTIQRAFRT